MEQLELFEKEVNNDHNFQDFNNQHRINDYVDTMHTNVNETKKLKVLSLFSGCGGLDLGFLGGFDYLGKKYEENPYEIIWANEFVKAAADTYKHNLGNHIIVEDINNITEDELPKNVDVVIGGFPCQDFSLAGKMQGLKVERGRLYLQMKRVIDITKPKAFIAENVKNLLMMEDGLILKTIIDDFKKSGYEVKFHLFHAADYGVPQNRERVIIYGVRSDLKNKKISLPKETNKNDWVTSFEAIDDLWDLMDKDVVSNQTTKDFSKAKFYEGRKMQGNVRIKADNIAPTIRSEHHGNIEGHYRTNGDPSNITNWRRLSIRECARLQSFPDNFVFPTATSNAYKQIGNAVPPVLGWHIARALYLSLKN